MPYIAIPLLSLAVVFLGLVGAYNFVPISAFEPLSFNEPTVGATITTINGSDTLSASRTVINNNFTALNSYKIENSTTSLPLITTLAGLTSATSLSSVGTITTGTWRGTPIQVAYNGTGTTSPTQYLVILGNGSAGLTHASSTGTANQVLTSNGAGAYPSWQTYAVDQSASYIWTGTNKFTVASTTILSLEVMAMGTSTNATTTIYGNVEVKGSLKYGGLNYGVIRTCSGQVTAAAGNGSKQTTVTCGFSPSIVNVDVVLPGSNGFSKGFKTVAGNFSIALTQDASDVGTSSDVYSLYYRESADGNYIKGTISTTTTGFTMDYTKLNYDGAIINYLAY